MMDKSIKIEKEVWKELNQQKLDKEMESISDVIKENMKQNQKNRIYHRIIICLGDRNLSIGLVKKTYTELDFLKIKDIIEKNLIICGYKLKTERKVKKWN